MEHITKIGELKGQEFLHGMEVLTSLGEGSYGEVTLQKCLETGLLVACKTQKHERHFGKCLDEIDVLMKLEHKNVISILAFAVDDVAKCSEIYLEFMDGGDLNDFMAKNSGGCLLERHCFDIFAQLTDGVEYIHGGGIAHTDIKPDNILMSSSGRVVLTDFNLCWNIYTDRSREYARLITKRRGTLPYMAPEMADQTNVKSGVFSTPLDIWACGVILYNLMTGMKPWREADGLKDPKFGKWFLENLNFHTKQKPFESKLVDKKNRWSIFDAFGYNFMHKILAVTDVHRFRNIQQMREHPWYKMQMSHLRNHRSFDGEPSRSVTYKTLCSELKQPFAYHVVKRERRESVTCGEPRPSPPRQRRASTAINPELVHRIPMTLCPEETAVICEQLMTRGGFFSERSGAQLIYLVKTAKSSLHVTFYDKIDPDDDRFVSVIEISHQTGLVSSTKKFCAFLEGKTTSF